MVKGKGRKKKEKYKESGEEKRREWMGREEKIKEERCGKEKGRGEKRSVLPGPPWHLCSRTENLLKVRKPKMRLK